MMPQVTRIVDMDARDDARLEDVFRALELSPGPESSLHKVVLRVLNNVMNGRVVSGTAPEPTSAYMTILSRECARCRTTRIVPLREPENEKCPKCGAEGYHFQQHLFIAGDVLMTAAALVASAGPQTEPMYEEISAMQLRRPEDYRIWWTSDGRCHELTLESMDGLPVYMQKEMSSRIGRVGRGRLWIPEGTPLEGMTEPYHAPDGWGGIVFHVEDMPKMKGRQGFITDMHGDIP